MIRISTVLATFSEFEPDDLPLCPQEFDDFKSKYLDIAHRDGGNGGDGGGDGGGEPEPSPLDGIDFELELIRRDEINVGYILALLASLAMAEQEGPGGAARAEMQRRRIFELLVSEEQLRTSGN